MTWSAMAWREIASEIAWRTRTSLSGFFASGRPALSVTNGETSRAESMCRYIRRNAGILNTETAGLAASLLMSGGGTLDDLHVAGQQRGHARGVGGQDAQRHAIPLRLLAPVGVVARQLQAVALGERDELVRSGADQRAAVVEIVGAGFLGGLLRHDVEGRQVVRHQRVRSVGGDAHGQLVERRDVLEAACVDGVRRRAVLDGGRPGQRVHHVGRGEFAAVVELHAGAQLELPHGVADGPPGDRQAGPHAHLVVLGDQRLEQVLGDVRVGGDVVEVRVERGDVARQADHQRGRRLRVGRGGCERHGKGQRGDRTRGAQQTQDQHDDSPKC